MPRSPLAILASLLVLIVPLAAAHARQAVPNENLANAIVAARQKNGALLKQLTWSRRTEIDRDGRMVDIRIDLLSFGPDGSLQRSPINDDQAKLPGRFLRRAIEEGQRQQVEKLVQDVGRLVEQYTISSDGRIVGFLVNAQVQPITTPQGTTLLQVSGSDVLVPGDAVTMTFDASTLHPAGVRITTRLDDDAVTLSGSFVTTRTGLNALQYATAEIPSRKIAVMIHDYDFTSAE